LKNNPIVVFLINLECNLKIFHKNELPHTRKLQYAAIHIPRKYWTNIIQMTFISKTSVYTIVFQFKVTIDLRCSNYTNTYICQNQKKTGTTQQVQVEATANDVEMAGRQETRK